MIREPETLCPVYFSYIQILKNINGYHKIKPYFSQKQKRFVFGPGCTYIWIKIFHTVENLSTMQRELLRDSTLGLSVYRAKDRGITFQSDSQKNKIDFGIMID
jgi:hypothetical protein